MPSENDEMMGYLRWLFGWRFLPSRFQLWLFGTGTRILELISGVGLLGYGLAFWVAPDEIYRWKMYYKFEDIPEHYMIAVFLSVGLLQLVSMWWQSVRGNVLSAYTLLVSGLVWFLVSVAFWSAYPPVHTGMVLPPLLAGLCLLAGNNALRFLFSAQRLRRLNGEA